MSDRMPNFRLSINGTPASDTRTVMPQSYPCQAPGCKATSTTIACPWHLAMIPLHMQNILTNALATGEAGSYSYAMAGAMEIWSEEKSK